jgi:16S rRNA (adenine1518-N6/adenine1519-N6)-dimethyltransferase
MAVYQPSELRLFLNQLGIFPRKGLSQNFLIDGNIIRKIVKAATVQPEEIVWEIGPGPGALTQALLEGGAHVVAVEKDRILAEALERLQTPSQQLTVYCDDVMTFPLEERLSPFLIEGKKAKVVANLPYHLTTPILTQLVPLRALFSSLTIMVQEEVARRMTAQPGSSEYSSLTLFLRFYTEPHYAFTVSRNCFYPAPKVDSAVVVLKLREPPLTAEEASSFFQLTRKAFEHRRKMLRASLKTLFPPQLVEEALSAIGQNPLARPEMLSLEQFLQLYHLMKSE